MVIRWLRALRTGKFEHGVDMLAFVGCIGFPMLSELVALANDPALLLALLRIGSPDNQFLLFALRARRLDRVAMLVFIEGNELHRGNAFASHLALFRRLYRRR